jgi:hypothetical protein
MVYLFSGSPALLNAGGALNPKNRTCTTFVNVP